MSESNISNNGTVVPFFLKSNSNSQHLIRGRVASIGKPVTSILKRHSYPEIIGVLQAEALAISACLSSMLDFEGIFTLQAKGDGPVSTLFADINDLGHLRGYCAFGTSYAEIDQLTLSYVTGNSACLKSLMGDGYIAVTVQETASGGRYQGIAELGERSLSQAAMHWFEKSAQLETLVMSAAGNGTFGWEAKAVVLQNVAFDGGQSVEGLKKLSTDINYSEEEDFWLMAKTLMSTITHNELIDPNLGPEEIIFRLFNTMSPQITEACLVVDQCRCNNTKVESMLEKMAPDEIEKLADESGRIDVTCEFCKEKRQYNKEQFL